MSDLKIKEFYITDKNDKNVKVIFTLSKLEELVDHFGSLKKVVDLINDEKLYKEVLLLFSRAFFGDSKIDFSDNRLFEFLQASFNSAMPEVDILDEDGDCDGLLNEDYEIDFDSLVYAGMKALSLPEREIWEMTPRKLMKFLELSGYSNNNMNDIPDYD